MFRNSLIAAIRTGCAVLVTTVLAFVVAKLGVQLPAGAPEVLGESLFVVAVGALNLVVSLLERRWPVVGFLLGVPKAPRYGSLSVGEIGAAWPGYDTAPDQR